MIKNLPANAGAGSDVGSILGSGRSPGEGIVLPGEFHGQRSLAGYSPWGHKESDTTEHAHAIPHQRCLCLNSQNLSMCYLTQYLSQSYYNQLPPTGNLLSHSLEARSIKPRYQQGVHSWSLRGRICSMPPSQLPAIADNTVLGFPWLVDTSISVSVAMQCSPLCHLSLYVFTWCSVLCVSVQILLVT